MASTRPRTLSLAVLGAAALAAALVVSGLPAGATARAAADVPLAGFEDAGSAGTVTIGDPGLDRAERSTDLATVGTHALRLSSRSVSRAGSLVATMTAGSTFPRVGWTGHTVLAMDATNAGAEATSVGVTITDTSGVGATASFPVPAFTHGAINFSPIYLSVRGVNPNEIASIRLTVLRPAASTVDLRLDDVRLTDAYPYPDVMTARSAALHGALQARLRTAVGDLGDDVARGLRGLPGAGGTAAAAHLRQEGEGLRDQVAALAARADQAGTPDLVTAVGQDLAAARQQALRWRLRLTAYRTDPGATLAALTADSMDLVYPQDQAWPGRAGTAALDLARGERENLQVVGVPLTGDVSGLRASVTSVTGTDGRAAGRDSGITTSVVPLGFLHITSTGAYKGAYTYSGWIPDPIRDDLTAVDVGDRTFQPYWVEVGAGRDARPGRYRVVVTLTDASGHTVHQRIDVRVWPVAIREHNELPTQFNVHPDQNAQLVYGLTDETAIRAYERKTFDFLERYRVEPNDTYAFKPVYNHATTTGWDAADLKYLKDTYGLPSFSAYYLRADVPTKVNLSDPSGWDADIKARLDELDANLKVYDAAGLHDQAYVYGFDEAPSAQFPFIKRMFAAVRAEHPDLPIVTTLQDPTYGATSAMDEVDVWAPEMDHYQHRPAVAARARGKQVEWYPDIATGHPYPNWFNGYPPMDARMLMGVMTHAEGVDGVLYYNISRWTKSTHKPITDGIYSAFDAETFDTTAGDGSLFYPGRTGPMASQRLANVRDGLDDYNLMQELQRRADRPGVPAVVRHQAATLLAAHDLADGATGHSEDSAALRSWRLKVLALASVLGPA